MNLNDRRIIMKLTSIISAIFVTLLFNQMPYSQQNGNSDSFTREELTNDMFNLIVSKGLNSNGNGHIYHFEKYGSLASDLAAEMLDFVEVEREKLPLLRLLKYNRSAASQHAPKVIEIFNEKIGKDLTEVELTLMLRCMKTICFIDPNSIETFTFLTKAMSEEYWNEERLPHVTFYDERDIGLVKERLRKVACDSLGYIGGEKALKAIESEISLEKERIARGNGRTNLLYVMEWTANYIRDYDTLHNPARN